MYLGDNCIQNVHSGRYIVGYMVGNFVLRWRVAIKRNFRPYNWRYTSPNEHFEYGYPHSNALSNIYLSKAQHFAPNWNFVSEVKQLRQPFTSKVTYDVSAPTVYHRIYWRKFLTLSNLDVALHSQVHWNSFCICILLMRLILNFLFWVLTVSRVYNFWHISLS